MGDVFVKQQSAIDKAKAIGDSHDVWGEPTQKHSCDNMETFKIEDCKTCPSREEC